MLELTLKRVKLQKNEFKESTQLSGIAEGLIFTELDIPFGPNPRAFVGKQNKNYMRMIQTLIKEPEMFLHKNSSGITIFASDYKENEDGSYTLFLNEKDGIANGGHTYMALKNFATPQSYVKLTIEVGLNPEKTIDIVESLNLSKKIELYSLQNQKGTFDWHKELLGESANDVIYFEGDTGFITVRESLTALILFSFNLKNKKRIVSNTNVISTRNLIERLENNYNHKQFDCIALDVHNLFKYITLNQNFVNMFSLSDKKTARKRMKDGSWGIASAVVNLILLAFASQSVYLDENNIVQWKQGFQTEALRISFINELFSKVFDILLLEEATISRAAINQSVVERSIKQAEVLAKMRNRNIQTELL